MSNRSPVDEPDNVLAVALGGAKAAACVDGSDAMGSGLQSDEDKHDEYDDVLAALGRTFDQDVRIAVHEAGHAAAARLLGHPLGGASVTPGLGYEGRVWGERNVEAFAEGRGDATHVREALALEMPQAGEDRRPVADVFGQMYAHCIELMAGRAAEGILLDGEPVVPADDLRQARELALLVCSSESAIETFIAHCDVAARDLLMPHCDAVIVLSTVLRIKRTLDGVEIGRITPTCRHARFLPRNRLDALDGNAPLKMRLDFALLSNCFVFAPIKGIRKVCSPRDHGESTALHILHKINFKSCS